jgi:hypothetical protein
VDDNARDPPASVRVFAIWDGEMDQPTAVVGQSVQFGCGLVTEHGVWSSPEQCAPEFGAPRGRAGEGRVDASVHDLPAPVTHLIPDPLNSHAGLEGLSNGEYAVLAIDQPKTFPWKFCRHTTSVRTAAQSPKVLTRTCG